MILTKMQGTGNDFLLVDARELHLGIEVKERLAKKLCQRRLSFGADGMIFLEESQKNDFRMDFYNADGSRGELCGNGARCLAGFALDIGAASGRMHFETDAGIVDAWQVDHHIFGLFMPMPTIYKELEVQEVRGVYLELGSPGVPHFCVEVNSVPLEDELRCLALTLRHHILFPKGTNINFYFVREKVHVLTFERGVEDFTLSCGSGVTSVAYHLMKASGEFPSCVKCVVPGGELSVESFGEKEIEKLALLGPVEIIYRAEYL